jgi:hypothetical protein
MNLMSKKEKEDDRATWDKAKLDIYKHNPIYGMDVRASNGKEAYLLFRRQEISGLFKESKNKAKDLFSYAEIASDLGVYDFAAHLFWITATFDSTRTKKGINHFLFCLDKLGEKKLKENFNENFVDIFANIEADKIKSMEKSSIYQSMKKE